MYYYGESSSYGSIVPHDFFQYYVNYVEYNPRSDFSYFQLNNNRSLIASPPGKKGFENLLKKYGYDKPYSTKCKIKGPLGTWTWGPCIKTETVVTGVYFGFNYPASVTPEQESAILSCGHVASNAGYAVIVAGAETGGPLGAIAAAPAANSTTRETLKKCLENAGLTTYIVKNTLAGIYTKRIS